MFPSLLLLASLLSSAFATTLHTSSRWILDENNNRVKFRCVNWAGHLETNIPEGLQHQPVDAIAAKIASLNFNCVRLTYSIDMALAQDVPVSESFALAVNASGAPADPLNALYTAAVQQNPFLSSATRIQTFANVIDSLNAHGVHVILDNHVSRAQWCCNLTDGNGWWDDAFGYSDLNSRWFNTTNWLAGLQAMATFAKGHDGVVGMSLRNEIRELPPQDLNNHDDWYSHVTEGANAVHGANPDLLIIIGGTLGATDISFLRDRPLDVSGWAGKVVWEYHVYSYSIGYDTGNCDIFTSEMGAAAGYLLMQNEAFTGPLWLSEFGVGWSGGPNNTAGLGSQDAAYLQCLVGYMESNDAEWSIWAIQGDYYVRDGTVSYNESYGVLNADWSDVRNSNFSSYLGGMWNATQGP